MCSAWDSYLNFETRLLRRQGVSTGDRSGDGSGDGSGDQSTDDNDVTLHGPTQANARARAEAQGASDVLDALRARRDEALRQGAAAGLATGTTFSDQDVCDDAELM